MGHAARLPHEWMTGDEYLARSAEYEHTELVDGVVVDTGPVRRAHGRVIGRFLSALGRTAAGEVACGVGFRQAEDRVRAADVSVYVDPPPDAEGWETAPPDLVVEVVSPNDTWPEVDRKADEWLAFGVREVWIADPARRVITVRRPNDEVVRLSGDAVLTSPVLPGFAAPLARIFR
jgi:Uma2 family endonuclease